MGRGGGDDKTLVAERLLYGERLPRPQREIARAWFVDGQLYCPGLVSEDPLIVQHGDGLSIYWRNESDGSLHRASTDPEQPPEKWSAGQTGSSFLHQAGRFSDGRHFLASAVTGQAGYRIEAGRVGEKPEQLLAVKGEILANTALVPRGEALQVISKEATQDGAKLISRTLDSQGRYREPFRFDWPDEDPPISVIGACTGPGETTVLLSTQNEHLPGIALVSFGDDGEHLARPSGQPLPASVENAALIPGDDHFGPAVIAQGYDRNLFYWNGLPESSPLKLSDRAARFGDECRAQAVRSEGGRDYVVWVEHDEEASTHFFRSAVIDPESGSVDKAQMTPENQATISNVRLLPAPEGIEVGWVETSHLGEVFSRARAAAISGSYWKEPETLLTEEEPHRRLRLRHFGRNSSGDLEALFQNGLYGTSNAQGSDISHLTYR